MLSNIQSEYIDHIYYIVDRHTCIVDVVLHYVPFMTKQMVYIHHIAFVMPFGYLVFRNSYFNATRGDRMGVVWGASPVLLFCRIRYMASFSN